MAKSTATATPPTPTPPPTTVRACIQDHPTEYDHVFLVTATFPDRTIEQIEIETAVPHRAIKLAITYFDREFEPGWKVTDIADLGLVP